VSQPQSIQVRVELKNFRYDFIFAFNPIAMNLLSAFATLALTIFCGAALAADEPKLLNIYNWSDYIAEDTIKNFENRHQGQLRQLRHQRNFARQVGRGQNRL
jgi:spermidine/putrescine-binding protein